MLAFGPCPMMLSEVLAWKSDLTEGKGSLEG